MSKTFATLGVAIAVITMLIAVLFYSPIMQPSRTEALLRMYPQLAHRTGSLAKTDHVVDDRKLPLLIPDPFLRSASETLQDRNYDKALITLLAAQKALRQEELGALARTAGIGEPRSRLDDARQRRDVAEQATADASLARDQASRPIVDTPGYRGILIQRDTIVLRFRDDIGAEAIHDFLTQQQLIVRAGIARIGLFIVEMEHAEAERTLDGDATRLRAVIDLLKEQTRIIDTAVQNSLLGPNIVPRPPIAATKNETRDWFAVSPLKDPLVLSNFPAAWNFNHVIKNRVNVGVLDVGFDQGICQQGDCDLWATPTCADTEETHGTAVASIIGATFDDQLGIDGACPFANLFTCAPTRPQDCDPKVSNCGNLKIQGDMFADLILSSDCLLRTMKAGVVNVSLGYNWSNFPELNPLNNCYVRQLVADQGGTVRNILSRYGTSIFVTSAGNDSARAASPPVVQPAVWSSPFNWAAQYGSNADRSPNVIVVEALQQDAVTGALSPSDYSNDGGDIAALGERVLDINLKDDYEYFSGTSAAAPLVAAAVAMMLAKDPTLTVGQIKTALDVGPGKQLNAFKALCASASDCETVLADLSKDGTVDATDFNKFKAGWLQILANQFTDDLNEDGVINQNDSMFSRIDLNGDGAVNCADLELLILAGQAKSSAQDVKILRHDLKCP